MVTEFTFQNYLSIIIDSYVTDVLFRTIEVAVATTIACAVLAYPIAYRMRLLAGLETMLLSLVLLTPLMISVVVLGYAWVIILSPNTGVLNATLNALGLPSVKLMFTPIGIVIGLVYLNLVFMVLSLHAALENIDETLLRAARVLGANPFKVFCKVIFPLSIPGLVSGSLIVFSISVSSFVMPLLLGGRQQPVLATYIWDMASYVLNWPAASATATILVVIVGAVNLVSLSWLRTVELRLGTGEQTS